MSDRDEVLQQALSLTPEDRIVVIAALKESLASVEPGVDIASTALLAELDRRMAAHESETGSYRNASEVIADLRRWQAHEAE